MHNGTHFHKVGPYGAGRAKAQRGRQATKGQVKDDTNETTLTGSLLGDMGRLESWILNDDRNPPRDPDGEIGSCSGRRSGASPRCEGKYEEEQLRQDCTLKKYCADWVEQLGALISKTRPRQPRPIPGMKTIRCQTVVV